jgi:hypothetical protein
MVRKIDPCCNGDKSTLNTRKISGDFLPTVGDRVTDRRHPGVEDSC